MNDLKPFKHGIEGTHYSCDVALQEGLGCCGCSGHDCPEEGAQGYLKLDDKNEGFDGVLWRVVFKHLTPETQQFIKGEVTNAYMKGQAHGMQIVAQMIKGMEKYPEIVGVETNNKVK